LTNATNRFDNSELPLNKCPKADGYKIVVKADKTPIGQHELQYHASTIDEVAIVLIDEEIN